MIAALIALLVFILSGFGLSFWLRQKQAEQAPQEAANRGAEQLAQLRWRDFTKLVLQAMHGRGYRPVIEDGMPADIRFYNDKAISVELPTTVVREITYTEPAVKGDTSGKVMKPAKIATGYEISVPLFCAQGDKIEIDTRTGEYRNRVMK